MNKSLLKVSRILTIITTCFMPFSIFIVFMEFMAAFSEQQLTDENLQIIYIILGLWIAVILILMILNIFAIRALKKAELGLVSKSKVMPWAIYLLITGGATGIVAILAVALEDNKQKQIQIQNTSVEQKLMDISSLYEKGIISKEEYDDSRNKIMETL